MPATEQISADEWQVIAKKRIIFGHQSVGNNILSGVRKLASEAGVNLNLIQSRNATAEFGITHFFIGNNGDPQSKINDFEETLRKGVVQGADIALMKLCYVDINANTDAKELAKDYIASLDRLSQQFPETAFVAVTVPLRTVQSGPKALLKRLIGSEPGGYFENFRRKEFNSILRNTYSPQNRIFDLAKLEAEGAGSYRYQGQPIEILNPLLTNDGGHLNDAGERYIAVRFLKFIAKNYNHQ
jgi:hypothetical protein